MKMGRFAEGNPQAETEEGEKQEKIKADAIPVGSRCEVTLPGTTPKRGTIMFVGMYFQNYYCISHPKYKANF